MSKSVLYLEDLLHMHCDNPDCDNPDCGNMGEPVFVAQNCHPLLGMTAMILPAKGMVELRCKICNKLIVSIAVASNPIKRN